jgi:hypothetical protein
MSVAMGPAEEPEAFADRMTIGTGTQYLSHTRRERRARRSGSTAASPDECSEEGQLRRGTRYLLHVWMSGFQHPLGVFGHANPALTCGDGTYYTDTHEITNACRQP